MTIRYEAEDLNGQLLEHAHALMGQVEAAHAVGAISDGQLAQARSFAARVDDQLRSPFELVIVGDFKRGKSTLINALLEAPLAPVDVTPETCTLNVFEYSSALSVTVELTDAGIVALEPGQLRRDSLRALAATLPTPIRRVRIGTPSPLLQDARLVDTPGFGEADGEFDLAVRDHLREADAVVYVLSAISPLSESEQAFLQEAVAPLQFSKLCFVVNFLDLLESRDDIDRVMSLAHARLSRSFPNAVVFGVSALDEWRRVSHEPRVQAPVGMDFGAAFDAFRMHVTQSILFNRDFLVTDRAATGYAELLNFVDRTTTELQTALQASTEQLESRVSELATTEKRTADGLEALETTLRAGMQRFATQTREWMDDFLARLDNDGVAPLGPQDFNRVRRHLPLYFSDRIREAMEVCLNAQRPDMIALLHDAGGELALRMPDAPLMAAAVTVRTAPVDDLPWSNMDLVTFGTQSMNLDAVTQVIIGLVRNVEHQNRTTSLLGTLREKLSALHGQVDAEIDRIYETITTHTLAQLKDACSPDTNSTLAALQAALEAGFLGQVAGL